MNALIKSTRLFPLAAASLLLAIPLACAAGRQVPSGHRAPLDKIQSKHPAAMHRPVGYKGTIVPKGAAGCLVRGQLDPNSRIMAPLRMLPGKTKVKVVKSEPEGAQIEVLAGNLKGKTFWIHWQDLR